MPPTCARLTGSGNTPVPIGVAGDEHRACVKFIFRPRPRSRGSCLLLCAGLEALHVVDAVAVLDAVRVVTEAGEALVPRAQRLQVAEIRSIGRTEVSSSGTSIGIPGG